jgi:tripartite-type tricarboxylate transporter receptor subunit TctC
MFLEQGTALSTTTALPKERDGASDAHADRDAHPPREGTLLECRLRRAFGRVLVAGFAALSLAAASPRSAVAQPAEFYAGKTLTIIVGLASGGTVDTFVRQFAGYLRKHIPGSPTIVVQNMPGAGGLLATNYLAERAPKDGSTIIYHLWDPLAQALGDKALRVRYESFEFLGGTSDTRVMYTRTDAVPGGLKAPADIRKADMLAIGALNSTDLSGLLPKLALEVLGIRHKLITGYRGGQDVFLALQRGEVHVHSTSIGTLRTRNASFLQSGEGMALAYLVVADKDGKFEPNPYIKEMPGFPALYREIHGKAPSGPTWDALNWMVQQVSDVMFVGLAPPGTPAPALEALRQAFPAAINDPEFVAHAVKTNGLPFTFVPVEKGKAVFAALAGVSPAVLDTVRKSIGEEKK